MTTAVSIARIGALMGDPTRAAMLQCLMDGRALTGSELADAAGVTPQTASSHLAQLVAGSLVSVARQGRHRYHRLATPDIASLLETLMTLAAGTASAPPRTGPRDSRMRLARTCYDHMAGWLGVRLADALEARGWIALEEDAARITPDGHRELSALGIAPDTEPGARPRTRPLCRPCLDWSERRPHLAGRLGAALCEHGLARNWIRRRAGTRALDVTPAGWQAFHAHFGIEHPSAADVGAPLPLPAGGERSRARQRSG